MPERVTIDWEKFQRERGARNPQPEPAQSGAVQIDWEKFQRERGPALSQQEPSWLDRAGQVAGEVAHSFTPSGIREQFDYGMNMLNRGPKALGKAASQFISGEPVDKESAYKGLRQTAEGVMGATVPLQVGALAAGGAYSLARAGLKGGAKFIGAAGTGMAAGEAAGYGTEAGLSGLGVNPDLARAAGVVVDVAADPFAIYGGLRAAGARRPRGPAGPPPPDVPPAIQPVAPPKPPVAIPTEIPNRIQVGTRKMDPGEARGFAEFLMGEAQRVEAAGNAGEATRIMEQAAQIEKWAGPQDAQMELALGPIAEKPPTADYSPTGVIPDVNLMERGALEDAVRRWEVMSPEDMGGTTMNTPRGAELAQGALFEAEQGLSRADVPVTQSAIQGTEYNVNVPPEVPLYGAEYGPQAGALVMERTDPRLSEMAQRVDIVRHALGRQAEDARAAGNPEAAFLFDSEGKAIDQARSAWEKLDLPESETHVDLSRSLSLERIAADFEQRADSETDPRRQLNFSEQARMARERADQAANEAMKAFEKESAGEQEKARLFQEEMQARETSKDDVIGVDNILMGSAEQRIAGYKKIDPTKKFSVRDALYNAIYRSVPEFRPLEAGAAISDLIRKTRVKGKRLSGELIEPLLSAGIRNLNQQQKDNAIDVVNFPDRALPVDEDVANITGLWKSEAEKVRSWMRKNVRIRGGKEGEMATGLEEGFFPRRTLPEHDLAFRKKVPFGGPYPTTLKLYKPGRDILRTMMRWYGPEGIDAPGLIPDAKTAESVLDGYMNVMFHGMPFDMAPPEFQHFIQETNPSRKRGEIATLFREENSPDPNLFGSIEKHRKLNLSAFSDKDFSRTALWYMQHVGERRAEIENYGQLNEKLDAMTEQVTKAKGMTADQARKLAENIEIAIGTAGPDRTSTVASVSNFLRKLQLLDLTFSGAANITQGANLLAITRRPDIVAKAMARMITSPREASADATRSGANIETAIRKAAGGELETGPIVGINMYGMTKTEDFNRTFGAEVGRKMAPIYEKGLLSPDERTRKLSEIDVKFLGLDPKKIQEQGGFSEDDILELEFNMSEAANFTSDAAKNFPIMNRGAAAPLAKAFLALKNFTIHQGKLTARLTAKDVYKALETGDPKDFAKAGGGLLATTTIMSSMGLSAEGLRSLTMDLFSSALRETYEAVGGEEEDEEEFERTQAWVESLNLSDEGMEEFQENPVGWILSLYGTGLQDAAAAGIWGSLYESSKFAGRTTNWILGSVGKDVAVMGDTGTKVVRTGLEGEQRNLWYDILGNAAELSGGLGKAIKKEFTPEIKGEMFEEKEDFDRRKRLEELYGR